ncbi:MAG TPA: YkvA family protein [Planctomycetota bacterium]|nr:YkvA family protein [Planctomycetota bacterium]
MSNAKITARDLPPGVELLPPESAPRSAQSHEQAAGFPWIKVGVLALLMLLYTGSPLDLIPDIIPFFGQLDDLLVNAGIFGVILRTVFKFYAAKRVVRPTSFKMLLRTMLTRSVFGWLFKK